MSQINTKILTLFEAYTAKEINQEQFIELQKWVNESTENEQLFSNHVLFYKKSRRIAFHDTLDHNKAWNNVVSQLKQPLVKTSRKKKTRKRYYKLAAAASIALIISLSIYFNQETAAPQFTEPVIVNNQIKKGSDKATLTLEDGSEVALVKGKTVQTSNAKSNGEEIVYQNNNQKPSTKNQIAYNYLTIPRGGQFQINLADGTKVWLNSDSQLKYPVRFTEGETRQVELVYGEAYFDVSPSTEHKGVKFQVYHNAQEVEVLGTQFNIKAYKDEANIYTTLVEGKVSVTPSAVEGQKPTTKILAPNQQSNLNIQTNKIRIATVSTYNEIAWKDGIFSFEDKPLKEMMKVLSRWYDVEVEFKNKEAENEEFIGVLRKKQNLNNILETIKNFGIIKEYTINNKKITIQ